MSDTDTEVAPASAPSETTAWKDAYWTVKTDYDRKVAELQDLRARLAAVEALPDKWDDASRAWYYANRLSHEHGIDYVAGFEAGWDNAGELLRRELRP